MTDQTPQEQPTEPQKATVAHPAFPDTVKREVPAGDLDQWTQQGWEHVTGDDAEGAGPVVAEQPTTVEAPAAATGTATATGTPGTSVPDASGPEAPPSAPTP